MNTRHPNRHTPARKPGHLRKPATGRAPRAGHASGPAAPASTVLVRLPDGRAFRVATNKAAAFLSRMAGKAKAAKRSLTRNQWDRWPHVEG